MEPIQHQEGEALDPKVEGGSNPPPPKHNDHDFVFRYLWSYFELHSEQRMRSFNFYLLIVAVLLGGAGTLIAKTQGSHFATLVVALPFPLALLMVTSIFMKLDQRNRFLIKHVEEELIKFEKNYTGTELKLFRSEVTKFKEIRASSDAEKKTKTHSYHECFSLLFRLFSGMAIVYLLLFFFLTLRSQELRNTLIKTRPFIEKIITVDPALNSVPVKP